MDAAIWGLLGTIVGALASIGTTWIAGRHAFGLQRESATLERAERFRAFQRETLIQLQDAMHDSLRLTTRAHIEDTAAFRRTGEWGKPVLSEEVNEGVLVAARRLTILIERVADDDLRAEIKNVNDAMNRVLMARTQVEADNALSHAYQTGGTALEHIGPVLRALY